MGSYLFGADQPNLMRPYKMFGFVLNSQGFVNVCSISLFCYSLKIRLISFFYGNSVNDIQMKIRTVCVCVLATSNRVSDTVSFLMIVCGIYNHHQEFAILSSLSIMFFQTFHQRMQLNTEIIFLEKCHYSYKESVLNICAILSYPSTLHTQLVQKFLNKYFI